MAIQSIGTNSILNNLNISNTTEEKTNGTSFSNVLSDAISKVNDSEVNANNKTIIAIPVVAISPKYKLKSYWMSWIPVKPVAW